MFLLKSTATVDYSQARSDQSGIIARISRIRVSIKAGRGIGSLWKPPARVRSIVSYTRKRFLDSCLLNDYGI
jgi:hypothetical protein